MKQNITDRPTEAQTDLQSAIVLAQAKQAQDPIDWQNNFNLALYYLSAGRFEESDGLYSRSSEASRDSIEMAIRDLDDYLTLFPDRMQAREVRDRLSPLVQGGGAIGYNELQLSLWEECQPFYDRVHIVSIFIAMNQMSLPISIPIETSCRLNTGLTRLAWLQTQGSVKRSYERFGKLSKKTN